MDRAMHVHPKYIARFLSDIRKSENTVYFFFFFFFLIVKGDFSRDPRL